MTTPIQYLTTAAYARWRRNVGTWTKQDFWDQLSMDEREAVFVANFNYQVCDGGLVQWYDNGYGTDEVLDYLIRLCTRLATPAAKSVVYLLSQANLARAALADETNEYKLERYDTELNKLDHAYREIADEFLALVEQDLTSRENNS